MSSWFNPRSPVCAVLFLASAISAGAVYAQEKNPQKYPGIGRTATVPEVKAWDIDVRPDFNGLPKGSGSVRQGEVLWEAQCASCHGSFGESSEIFTPIAGGTVAADRTAGRVASLLPGANQPQRTTLMKVPTLSTLWDYINRAMPWNAPKTLSTDEVYAVTAFILNLGNIVPADFTLSDTTIREVQQTLPNRNGMTTAHAMWPGTGLPGTNARPDVQGSSCQRDCKQEPALQSALPDYARNAHGQLSEQSRLLGATRGADTSQPAALKFMQKTTPTLANIAQAAPEKVAKPTFGQAGATAAVMPLLQKNACVACHGMDSKLVGPSFKAIAQKYKTRADAVNYLSEKIKDGGQGVWGNIPMPAQALNNAEAAQLAQWLVNF
ncbi:MAG: c-type cytochrome [Polaromonas sp.]|nr:c-type cytochrome [Polaromonas sp.]